MGTSAAASRTARIVVRRFASAAEADRHELEYWLSIPAPERVLQVWRLSVDLWRWRGEFRDEPGLCRSEDKRATGRLKDLGDIEGMEQDRAT